MALVEDCGFHELVPGDLSKAIGLSAMHTFDARVCNEQVVTVRGGRRASITFCVVSTESPGMLLWKMHSLFDYTQARYGVGML